MTDEAVRVLDTSLFFEPFAAEDLRWLRTEGAVVTAEADEVFSREGEPADKFYVLVDGTVELSTAPAADDLRRSHRSPLRTVVAPGQPLGWSAFRPPYRYSDSVRSHRPSRLLRLPRSSFDDLFARDPAVAHELLRRVNVQVVKQLEFTRELFDSPQAQGQEL